MFRAFFSTQKCHNKWHCLGMDQPLFRTYVCFPLLPIRGEIPTRKQYSLPLFVSFTQHHLFKQLLTYHKKPSEKDQRHEKYEPLGDLPSNWRKEFHSIPNYITTTRILSSPFLTYAVIFDMKFYALGGVLLFGFTDWLDGYLAKRLSQQTTIGAFLDPLADKVMIGSLTIGLVWKGLFPFELAALILSRDLFLGFCSAILRVIDKPHEAGFWDFSSSTFQVVPTLLSKINTGLQFGLLTITLGNFALGYPPVSLFEPLWWITATTTLGSWIGYLDGSGIKYVDLKEKAKLKARSILQRTTSSE